MRIVYGNIKPYRDILYTDSFRPLGERVIDKDGVNYYAYNRSPNRSRVKNAFEHIEREFYEKNGYLPQRVYPAYTPVPAYRGPDYEGMILARQESYFD